MPVSLVILSVNLTSTQELLTRKLPYYHLNNEAAVIFAIATYKLPKFDADPALYATYIWEMCLDCWKKSPAKRPTMTNLVEDIVGIIPVDCTCSYSKP